MNHQREYTKDDNINDLLEIQREEEREQEESDERRQAKQKTELLETRKNIEAATRLFDKDNPPDVLDSIKGACAAYDLFRKIL